MAFMIIPEGVDLIVQDNLRVNGTIQPGIGRTNLIQDNNQRFKIQPTDWRVWDALQTNLPSPAANDDLGLVGGTFGTGTPSIQTGDLKAAGATTRYARCTFELPAEYVAGQSVTIRAHAGMLTTAADTSATLDFQLYRSNDEAGLGSDLVADAAQDINSTSLANFDFDVTPNSLNPGDTLDIRMAVAVNDGATGTAVIGFVGSVEILLDIKG